LFINEAYLDAEHPEEYHVEKMVDAALLIDGKDYMVEVKQSDRTLQHFQISSKVHHAAARLLTWMTPMGLGVENTRAFSARVTEEALNELWGSFGVAHTNVKDWKDYEKDDVGKKKFQKLKLRTALDGVSTKE
jgi:hypothetical protein